MKLLEISLKEGNSKVRTVKCRRIKIRICEIIKGIKRILKSTLEVIKPLFEIPLRETVIRERLFKLKKGLLGKL